MHCRMAALSRTVRIGMNAKNSMFATLLLASCVLFAASCATTSGNLAVRPKTKVPVVYDADVVVAGGGLSGMIAAIAAARNGAQTVLIERFESLGGISGPGVNIGGGMQGVGPVKIDPREDYPKIWVYPEIAGITRALTQRLDQLKMTYRNYTEQSGAISYVVTKMVQESGVKLLLSTYVADPIMEGETVKGLFVENKSGCRAVKAKVVIDATGEADVARRAGAPVLYPKESYHKIDGHAPTGIGIFAYIGGVNWKAYKEAIRAKGPAQNPASRLRTSKAWHRSRYPNRSRAPRP
jgi:ribulose 1,5-bisphosphate synthetase/thiazole synthase